MGDDTLDKERLDNYRHLREFESDFDRAQAQLRSICSVLSAAVVGATATILVRLPDAAPHVEQLYIVHLLLFLGSGGVLALWYIDQGVYQRLLHTVFGYGLHQEFKHPDLPQLRTSLWAANLDVTSKLGWYYRTQFWAFLLISSLIALYVLLRRPQDAAGSMFICIGHFVFVFGFNSITGAWPSLRDLIRRLYPDLDSALPIAMPPNGSRSCDPKAQDVARRIQRG